MKPVKIVLSIAFLIVAVGAHSATQGQSGRVKSSPKKPTVAPVPVALPDPTAKSKKSALPQIVDGERIYLGREVDTKAFIWKKPAPGTTKEAKRNSFHGKILIEAILATDGKVTNITILKGLPYGLNQKALEAAQQIRFEPATIDGKPVSTWVQLEYEFWFV